MRLALVVLMLLLSGCLSAAPPHVERPEGPRPASTPVSLRWRETVIEEPATTLDLVGSSNLPTEGDGYHAVPVDAGTRNLTFNLTTDGTSAWLLISPPGCDLTIPGVTCRKNATGAGPVVDWSGDTPAVGEWRVRVFAEDDGLTTFRYRLRIAEAFDG